MKPFIIFKELKDNKVELTKEQEEIALKVAKISGMPWCAVDIMPLVKGSNPEIGDNVVLVIDSNRIQTDNRDCCQNRKKNS